MGREIVHAARVHRERISRVMFIAPLIVDVSSIVDHRTLVKSFLIVL